LYRKILVGYDGSAPSKRALVKAASLAKALNAELKIVVGTEPSRSSGHPHILIPTKIGSELDQEHVRIREEAVAKAAKAVDEINNSLKMPSDKVTSSVAEVHEGEPSRLILSQSETFGADLIVVGSRGLSALDKFILGSVSTAVVNKSTIDVLIVK
jgi:nucleotide-binding universal stress UspA family protein